jgi:hypothetical protein
MLLISVMGRTVVVAWLFVTGILYSFYTVNLSALLTTPCFKPTLNDIHGLVVRPDVKIAYWNGSFTRGFLISEFRIDQKRLIPLTREDDYYKSLSSGRVGVIIDERPIMQSLVPNNCSQLTFASQSFATLNWGLKDNLINAYEYYSPIDTQPTTSSQDIEALDAIKRSFDIKDGMSDPCYLIRWNGIRCDNRSPGIRISKINWSE